MLLVMLLSYRLCTPNQSIFSSFASPPLRQAAFLTYSVTVPSKVSNSCGKIVNTGYKSLADSPISRRTSSTMVTSSFIVTCSDLNTVKLAGPVLVTLNT